MKKYSSLALLIQFFSNCSIPSFTAKSGNRQINLEFPQANEGELINVEYLTTSHGIPGNWSPLGLIKSPYTHDDLVNGTEYCYRYTNWFRWSDGECAVPSVWTVHDIDQPSGEIIMGDSILLAPGSDGQIYTSVNGTDWTPHAVNSAEKFWRLAYGNGLYIGLSYAGSLISSTDGIHWSQPYTFTHSGQIGNLVFGGGIFAINTSPDLTPDLIYISADGVNWSEYSTGLTPDILAFCYTGGQFIATGFDYDTGIGYVMNSSDAITWTSHEVGYHAYLLDIIYGASLYIAVGRRKLIMTSPDLVTWTERVNTNVDLAKDLGTIEFNGNIFVVAGEYGQIFTSTDGIQWTASASPFVQDSNFIRGFDYEYASHTHFYTVIWDGTKFIIQGVDESFKNPFGFFYMTSSSP